MKKKVLKKIVLLHYTLVPCPFYLPPVPVRHDSYSLVLLALLHRLSPAADVYSTGSISVRSSSVPGALRVHGLPVRLRRCTGERPYSVPRIVRARGLPATPARSPAGAAPDSRARSTGRDERPRCIYGSRLTYIPNTVCSPRASLLHPRGEPRASIRAATSEPIATEKIASEERGFPCLPATYDRAHTAIHRRHLPIYRMLPSDDSTEGERRFLNRRSFTSKPAPRRMLMLNPLKNKFFL